MQCALRSPGAVHIMQGIIAGGALRSLDISSNGIDEAGAACIGEMLRSCSSLTSLFCRSNALSFSGGQEVAQGYLDRG